MPPSNSLRPFATGTNLLARSGLDAQFAARVREMFADDLAEREQTMFGALAFLVDRRVVA
jgi:hypothetical protein